jgi:hypothetical protein
VEGGGINDICGVVSSDLGNESFSEAGESM